LGRRSNYIEDPKIAKEKKLKNTSTKEVTNQGSEKVFSKSRGNSPRYVHKRICILIWCAQHGILTPS
jgi:hypothetical protein